MVGNGGGWRASYADELDDVVGYGSGENASKKVGGDDDVVARLPLRSRPASSSKTALTPWDCASEFCEEILVACFGLGVAIEPCLLWGRCDRPGVGDVLWWPPLGLTLPEWPVWPGEKEVLLCAGVLETEMDDERDMEASEADSSVVK
jgi:hypothetical protein